jgi:hypothetical protein
MNCHDAREGFSALFHGGMGLTEWALLDAHVRQCVECRKERESVQAVVNARQQGTPSRALLHGLGKMLDAIRLRTTSLATWLTRVGMPLAISLTVAGLAAIEASRVVATRIVDPLTRARWLLPALLKLSERTAASVIEATRVGITWDVGLLARTRCVLPSLCTLSERTAVKAIGATWVVGRIVVTTSGRARSLLGLSPWTSPLSHACSFRRVSTGIASLAILVATIVFLWPREWPDNLKPRPSTGGQLSQDVRPPADRKPVEPAAAAQLAETQTHKSVSAPQPAPAAVSQPAGRRVTIRPKPLETQVEILAPLRTPDPALAQSRAAASAQTPTPETTWSREPSRLQESARSQDRARSQNAEASDPAIDWVLKGGRGASWRSIESP